MPYQDPEPHEREPRVSARVSAPMAWEDASLSLWRRAQSTFWSAFAPVASVRAAAVGPTAPALGFALLSALPFMLLWGIVPFTQRLLFGAHFSLEVRPGPLPISVDIVRAAGIGLAFSVASTLAWAVPFASLLRAFAGAPLAAQYAPRAAWRTTLYRMWLVPCGLTLLSVAGWAMPANPLADTVELVRFAFLLLPRAIIGVHCFAMARYFGASTLGALAVALVPVLVGEAVGLFLRDAVLTLLPDMPRA